MTRLLRRSPGTLGYLAVLLVTHVVVFHVLAAGDRRRVLRAISTNLAAMDSWSAPPRLVGSALVVDTSGTVLDVVLIVGVGIAACLGALEWRFGTVRALGLFVLVHVVASVMVLVVVALAVRAGRYPDQVRYELDYGVSFGAIGAIGAVTWLVPRRARPPWAAVAVLYPLTAATWYGWLPDYSTVGHVLSAAVGLAVPALLVRPRPDGAVAARISPEPPG